MMLVGIGISIGLSMLAAALRPKPKIKTPGADIPTPLTTRGSYLPIIIGTRRVAPVFAWAGNRRVKTNKQGGKGLGGGGVETQTWYEAGWHLLAVGPVTGLNQILQDGRVIYNTPITPDDTPSGSQITMLDGEGTAVIYWGELDQSVNTFLGDAGRIGISSRWPHVCYIQWTEKALGSSPRWPNLEYEITSASPCSPGTIPSNAWIDESSAGVGDDGVNPQHALWQLLTAPYPQGCAIDTNLIDGGSLDELGTMGEDEHLPVNLYIEDGQEGALAIADMMADVGFTLVQVGAKLAVVVCRQVNGGTVPILDESIVSPPDIEITRAFRDAGTDRVVYTFKDRAQGYRDMDVQMRDDARATSRRRVNVQKVELPTAIAGRIARKMANRRILEHAAEGDAFTFRASRGARQIVPGQVFNVEGVGQLRLAAITPAFTTTEAQLEAVADPYAHDIGDYEPGDQGIAGGDVLDPQPDLVVKTFQMPGDITSDKAIGVARVRANDQIVGAEVWISEDDSSYVLAGHQDAPAYGGTLLQQMLDTDGTGSPLVVATGPEVDSYNDDILNALDLTGRDTEWEADEQLLIIDDEVFDLRKFTATMGGWQIIDARRERFSTTAATHAIGADAVAFAKADMSIIRHALIRAGATICVKTRPFTSTRAVDLADVTAVTVTIA